MIEKIKKKVKIYYNKDIQFFVENSKFKLGYQFLIFTTGFLISWLFANFTSSKFYGIYLLILSISGFFSFFSFSGINSSIIQSVASGYEQFYISGMKKILKFSILGSIAIYGFSIYYILFVDNNFVILISLLILGSFFPFSYSFSAYHSFLEGKMLFKKDIVYKLIVVVTKDLLILFLIFYSHNLILHFLLLGILNLMIDIFITIKMVNTIQDKVANLEKEKEAIKYGFFLTKYSFLTTISNFINNLLIGITFGPEILAFYIIGIGLPSKLLDLTKPAFSVLLSRYSKKSTKIGKTLVGVILLLSLFIFICVIVALPFFLLILFPNYLSALKYGLVYAIIILIQPITIIFGYYFRGKVNKKAIRNSEIASNISKLGLLIPFIFLFGIYGIILSEIVRWISRFITYLFHLKKSDF